MDENMWSGFAHIIVKETIHKLDWFNGIWQSVLIKWLLPNILFNKNLINTTLLYFSSLHCKIDSCYVIVSMFLICCSTKLLFFNPSNEF